MMKIFIAGSCVSRDAFNENNQDSFSMAGYFARYSLARLAYPTVQNLNLSEKEFSQKVPSAFQRKILKQEWDNILIERIQQTEFDCLLIDLVDERFGLVEMEPGVYITNSDELRNSRIMEVRSANKLAPDSTEFISRWEEGFKKLIDVASAEKIIINNVFWSDKLDSGEGFEPISNPKRIKYCNTMVSTLYDIAAKYLNPKTQFVNYPRDIFVGDSNHKWGKSPFHYTKDVYEYLITFLLQLDKK